MCRLFESEKIEKLLYIYSNRYIELVINIFEIVLLESIACKLVEKNVFDLVIDESELVKIYKIFEGKNEEEIKDIVMNVCNEICMELFLKKENLQNYIYRNLDNLVSVIVNGVKQNTLNKVFLTQKFVEC